MNTFVSRHLGATPSEQEAMLAALGLSSMDALVEQTIPANIILQQEPALAPPLSEQQYLQKIKNIAKKNQPLRTLIGMGYYGTAVPAAILRNIFENPAWYTSYTPYQAEISQGRLEALLNFQTMICSLTGMEISNCSLLCEGTAAAEAAHTMFDLRNKESVKNGRNILFVDENIFPQTLAVVRTRCEAQGIVVHTGNFLDYEIDDKCYGAIVQYPAANGDVRDYSTFAQKLHTKNALLTAVCDILSLVLLPEPAAWGADIAVGSTQRFGTPMGFGGPHAAYMACRKAYVRSMPGRIIGVSRDRLGNRALRMALQTREQHIKRERAGSNICTAQALTAVMAGMYATYHGAVGLQAIAQRVHRLACLFAKKLTDNGVKIASTTFFDTIELHNICTDATGKRAAAAGFNLYYPEVFCARISFDELSTEEEVVSLLKVFNISTTEAELSAMVVPSPLPVRESPILVEQVFQKYHTETSLMRYIKTLERRDISLTHSMIPLGSCTMKLNAAATLLPLSWTEFADVHPYVPANQAAGYHELIGELCADLAAITGLPLVSLQPGSGASGEYAGLMMLRNFFHTQKEQRSIALIPASAHGTNPASAAMAGMQVVVVACDEKGNISTKNLAEKIEEYGTKIACLMLTYPSTHGVFEENVREIIDLVHSCGALVYMDGANMNAQTGYTNPAAMDADICHLNLHKTFAMPHGGGGPGVGAICATQKFADYMPTTLCPSEMQGKDVFAVGFGTYGNALLLPITYGYIKMMGASGLRHATAAAILNANYVAQKLQPHYDIVYMGKNGRAAHECIVDCRSFMEKYGVGAGDIARRLMDYGFHAPTVSFPVHETLMVEPTESESMAELDRFVDALVSIKQECEQIARGTYSRTDNPIVNAPHTAAEIAGEWEHSYSRETGVFPMSYLRENKFFPHVAKIDHGYGDRNLVGK